MHKKIAVLPGDGIGPEIMEGALLVLEAISKRFGHNFELQRGLIGGAAWQVHGRHFPDETLELCRGCDAILFGSVGGPIAEQQLPKWKNCEANSLLAVRKAFSFSCNFRPARVYPQLSAICPLRADIANRGIDVLIVRELIGDVYFGTHERFSRNGFRAARDIGEYDEQQIREVARRAFTAAGLRRARVTSVDKANVLETSRLWREIVTETASEFPEIALEHMLVDNCAMQLITNPSRFDVVLTSNLFGDILSDEAAVFPGSLGLTPSASLNSKDFGFYEPSGGSAPDIAGKGIANPIAQILSLAMLLRYSFKLVDEPCIIEKAVEQVLNRGLRTADIAASGELSISTMEMAAAIASEI